MENVEQPELCRLHTLTVARVDKRGVWLEAGGRLAHLSRREAPHVTPGEQLEVFLYQDVAEQLQATCRPPLAQAGEFALLTVRSVDPHGHFSTGAWQRICLRRSVSNRNGCRPAGATW